MSLTSLILCLIPSIIMLLLHFYNKTRSNKDSFIKPTPEEVLEFKEMLKNFTNIIYFDKNGNFNPKKIFKEYSGQPPSANDLPEFLDPNNIIYNKNIKILYHGGDKTKMNDILVEFKKNNPEICEIFQEYQEFSMYDITGYPIEIFDTGLYFEKYFFGQNTWIVVLISTGLFISFFLLLWNWYNLCLSIKKMPTLTYLLVSNNYFTLIYPTLVYIIIVKICVKLNLDFFYYEDIMLGYTIGLFLFHADFFFNLLRIIINTKKEDKIIENNTPEPVLIFPKNFRTYFWFFKGHYLQVVYLFFMVVLIYLVLAAVVNLSNNSNDILQNIKFRPELYTTDYTTTQPKEFIKK